MKYLAITLIVLLISCSQAPDVLDKILNLYIEEDSSSEKIIASGVDPNLVFDVLEKVDRNEYKRKQVAPGVKLTQKAFGKDRRMPITNTYIRQKE